MNILIRTSEKVRRVAAFDGALRVSAVYVLAGLIWILFSDRLLGLVAPDPALWLWIQSIKGAAFVLGSGFLIYVLVRKALRAVRESQAESRRRLEAFKALVESLSDALTILEPDGTVRYVSPAFERIAGYAADERVGKSALGRVHPDDLEATRAAFNELVATPGARAIVYPRIRHKDGSWRTVRLTGQNLTGHPAVKGVAVTYSDITRQVKAENELRESEERFRLMVEGSEQVFFYEHDEQGRFTYLSPSVAQVLGYEPDDLLGRPYSLLLADDPSAADVHAISAQALTSGERADPYTALTKHEDGRDVALELIERPLISDGVVLGLQGFARDITTRLNAERDLRHSEERFRSLIENASDTVSVVDAEGIIRFQSSSIQRLLELHANDLLGEVALRLLHPEDRAGVAESFRLLKGRGEGASCSLEFRCRGGDGRWRVMEANLQNRLSDSAIHGVVVNARDVTASRLMEEQFRQAQKMEAVGRLAGGVAHDFNNILTAITGHVELVLQDLPEGSDQQRDLQEIGKSAARARDLTRQLLAFSRQQVLRPRVVEPAGIVEEMNTMLDRLIGEKIRLETELREPPRIKADPGQIQQVVMNLVVNARDAMPNGGRIRLGLSPASISPAEAREFPFYVASGDYALLTVSDDGEGMHEETLEHAFDPFYTTKGPGKGTGLGLSTVYGIVKQSGGYICVDSERGRGTTFRIYLPATAEKEESWEGDEAPAAFHPASPNDHVSGTVLIVEDEEPVRRLIERILAREGYSTVVAENGEQALERMRAEGDTVDLVLTDVVMPDMGGAELGRRMQASYPHVKMVYMSGYAEDEIAHGGELDPHIPFLEKPFPPQDLLGVVRRARGSQVTAQ